jgi:hypothetical protein
MSILISSSCRVLVSSSQLLNYDANGRTATDPYDANGKNVTVLQALKNIATNNLVNAAFPNGLVHVFQQASQFPIAYDEDNSEDYKGLEDFGNFLNSIGDSSASTYLNAAANIPSGMQQTYTNNVYNGTTTNHNYLNLPGFLNAWQEDSGFTGPLPMSNPSPTMWRSLPTVPALFTLPWWNLVCAITSLAPIPRAPTAKPNASFKPPCGNGHTPACIKTRKTATNIFFPGFTTTTGTVLMVASTMLHLSAALASTGTTS